MKFNIFIITGLTIFSLLFSTAIFADEITIFDTHGDATAYIEDDSDATIFLWSGEPVAYLDGDSIYGFNGKHLGWINRGIVYDHNGYILGFLKGYSLVPTNFEPFKSFKQFKPFKSFKEFEPLKPLFGQRMKNGLRAFLQQGK